jgi:hypothetical protein
MTASFRHFILTAALLALPCAAFAQGRTPHTDSAAVGGDIGIFLPRDDRLDSGLTLDGFYEYYVSPRVSLRMGLGWADPKEAREHDDSLRHVRISFDVVHNWEHGAVHPFVGAGIGVYFLQRRDNGESFGDSENQLGGALFGGAEFFTTRTVSVKAEASYHVISDAFGINPDGLALTVGLKKYF